MYIYFIYLVIELERLTHKQPNSQKHLIGEGKMTISSKSEDVDSLKHTILKWSFQNIDMILADQVISIPR